MSMTAGPLSSEYAGEQGGAPSTSKRTRFDTRSMEDEEVDGDLDIQEQDRKRLQQGRRGRVMTDGYESDSSVEGDDPDEDEEVNEADGKRQKPSDDGRVTGVDEDDENMFDLQEDGKEGGGTDAKVKPKKYLDLKDIEGQEFGEPGSEDDDNDDDGRDPDLELESDADENDENSATLNEAQQLHDPEAVVQPLPGKKGKRTKKGGDDMGFELDSFNMKNEMTAGRFDQDGNYIPNVAVDPHAEHDQWLQGHYSRKSIKAAKDAKAQREQEAREQERKRQNAFSDEDECKMRLASLMRRRETVLQALQRLGAAAKKAGHNGGHSSARWRKQSKQRAEDQAPQQADLDSASKDDDVDGTYRVKTDLDAVTSLTSELMSRHGITGIYDETYESLAVDVRRSGLVRATWDPAAATEPQGSNASEIAGSQAAAAAYLYRWSPQYLEATSAAGTNSADGEAATSDEQTFGPFAVNDLRSWKDSGFFGDAGERILLRPEGAPDSAPWRSWTDIFD